MFTPLRFRPRPIRPIKALILAALMVAGFGPQRAAAETIRFGPGLPGWSRMTFPGIAPANFSATADETLVVATDSAAGMLWRPLSGATSQLRAARWRWRVEQGVAASDLTQRGADDRAVAVYFVFSEKPDGASGPLQVLASPAVTALVYVFGDDRARGSVIASPHMGQRGKFIVLRAAGASKQVWLDEAVDLASDYRRAFGRAKPALIGLAIASDSDDTHGQNRASIRDFVLGE